MRKLMIAILALTSISASAMTCTKNGLTLEVKDEVVTVKKHGSIVNVLTVNNEVWDGHAAGLITGKGFAISYQNHFGCYRWVKYTGPVYIGRSNIQTVDFGSCAGGLTPDDLCLGN